jgi:hypothetical protein
MTALMATGPTGGVIDMVDLAPEIFRQRLVIEGLPRRSITARQIRSYLAELSSVLDMVTVLRPVTHRSDQFGWAGWIHWETSGAHFYGWDAPRLFFSADIYTCKAFSADTAVAFTRDFFDPTQVAYREF